jgi:SAM-dependent methyltransferase
MGGLYADPVLYDILYTPGTAAEVDALERVERRFSAGHSLKPKRLWLEPACGTGRYLRLAAGRGRRCLGFDIDEGQLAYARGRKGPPGGPSPRFIQADMTDFARACRLKPASVDFAFNPVNSLRHLPTDRAMLDHFAQMAVVLRPGSVYVVGISLTDYSWLLPEEDLWEGARGRCRVSQLVNYLPPEPGTRLGRVERVVSHLTITRPGGVEHLDDTYDLRCFDEGQWSALVRRSALRRLGSFDTAGRPLAGRVLPYQLEVLGPR